MSERGVSLEQRLEELRLRGRLQRAEAVLALRELRADTRQPLEWLALAARVRGVLRGGAFLRVAGQALSLKPWMLPVGMGLWRLARRHSALAVAGAAAALLAVYLMRSADETALPDRPPPD
jgi:hypothetical protein